MLLNSCCDSKHATEAFSANENAVTQIKHVKISEHERGR